MKTSLPMSPPLADTFAEMIRAQEPNFLRLYLNPHVASVCYCLDRYVQTTWGRPNASDGDDQKRDESCQSFLANGLDEATSGAIKLARYNRAGNGSAPNALILDPSDRLIGFGDIALESGKHVSLLPGVRVLGKSAFENERASLSDRLAPGGDLAKDFGINLNPLVLVADEGGTLERYADEIRRLVREFSPLVITCVDRSALDKMRSQSKGLLREIVPDIVVFDESFVDWAVPFGAFTARTTLFAPWNRLGKATFHSTTFQPNTVSAAHFMQCLAAQDPDLFDQVQIQCEAFVRDVSMRAEGFRTYYGPALFRLIRATGLARAEVHTAGSFIVADGRAIFDGVSGVACSFRGHNPAGYVDEILAVDGELAIAESRSELLQSAARAELGQRLWALTGLEHFVPAVSGATAVENALKLALVAQYPRRAVLALASGFGGKTLLSLTGTANPSYKERVDPLYPDVHYVDPFANDALEQIDKLMAAHEFAVVQLELIQGVGGVRAVPERVVQHLSAGRARGGYLLLIDEVQTGMYRTGPFTRSETLGLTPDLLLLGKAVSDMMFPCALTLFSEAVHTKIAERGARLLEIIWSKYGYDWGLKTALNVLRLAERLEMPARVARTAAVFSKLLNGEQALSRNVREVRVFGLLIGVELDTTRGPRRWLRKRLATIYLLAMLRHQGFPVLAGLCQYEPNVIKITPALNASDDEVRRACATIIDVLNRPLYKVLAGALKGLFRPALRGNRDHEHGIHPALEPVAR